MTTILQVVLGSLSFIFGTVIVAACYHDYPNPAELPIVYTLSGVLIVGGIGLLGIAISECKRS